MSLRSKYKDVVRYINNPATSKYMKFERKKEENAIVLDFLPNGYPDASVPSHRKTAIAHAIGLEHFSLLELVPKKDTHLTIGENVYIGDGKREKIHHINGKISIMKLTGTADNELSFILKDLVAEKEAKFVEFFNKSGPLSLRMHQLELLPGLGKKHMLEILKEREDKEFESFADIKERVKAISKPEEIIVKRILQELEGTEKYNIFVR